MKDQFKLVQELPLPIILIDNQSQMVIEVNQSAREYLQEDIIGQKKETAILSDFTFYPGSEGYTIGYCSIDQKSTSIQKDFISTISHEFRTPLTSIKGFADTLITHGDNLDSAQQKRFITIIKNQADRMIRLTENLLAVSKLGEQKPKFSFRPIPLEPMLNNLSETLKMKYQNQFPVNLSFEIMENLPPLWADSDSLEQVLLNLVDNAIKYSSTKPDPKVTIKACLCEEGENIKISVTDNGIGMSAEQLKNLFHKFYRVEDPLTQQIEGTGLGLYITKSLTTAMNGSINVESVLKEGSTFIVTFPAATEEKQALYQRRKTQVEKPSEGISDE